MARTVRDAKLQTREARLRLKLSTGREPYWRAIEKGRHLGYYKGERGGSWLARIYIEGAYRKTSLGSADDVMNADGHAVLSFEQAQEKARVWFEQQCRIANGLEAVSSGPYTVEDAMAEYLKWYESHRKAFLQTKNVVNVHILPVLGNVQVVRLTASRLRDWHAALAQAPARKRSRMGQAIRSTKAAPKGPEAIRKRRATANRILTILKAALNHAWQEGLVPSDDAWRRVKPFHDVEAPVVRYLGQDECTRLLNAALPGHRPMFHAGMLTGCRYSELARVTVSDVNLDSGTLAIYHGKSGKTRNVVLTKEAQKFFAQQLVGKASDALVLTRDGGEPWGRNHLQRPLLEACKRAGIKPAISFHILRHTHGSLLAMQGVPMQVISKQLGHADTRMTERHYAHLSPNYVADTIRAHFPVLGGKTEAGNVTPLAGRRNGLSG